MNNANEIGKSAAAAERRGQTELEFSVAERDSIIDPWREAHNAVKRPSHLDNALLQQYQQQHNSGSSNAVWSKMGWRFSLGAGLVAASFMLVVAAGPILSLLVPDTPTADVALAPTEPTIQPWRGQPELALVTQGVTDLRGRLANPSTTISARYRPDLTQINRASVPALASLTRVTDLTQRLRRGREMGTASPE